MTRLCKLEQNFQTLDVKKWRSRDGTIDEEWDKTDRSRIRYLTPLLEYLARKEDKVAAEILTWPRGKFLEAIQTWIVYINLGDEASITSITGGWHRKQRALRVGMLFGTTDKYMRDLENYKVTPALYPEDEAMEILRKKGGDAWLLRNIKK